MDIDFDKQMIKLGHRSSKIIGGYVTEYLFIDRFANTDNIVYSKDWWFSKSRKNNRKYYFVETNNLSSLDIKVATLLQKKGQECYQLYKDKDSWKVASIVNKENYTISEFLIKNSIDEIEKYNVDKTISADEMRQLKRCIEYYKKINVVTDIERSIQIEDAFLNKYFYSSNIDLIIDEKEKDHSLPICLEIKFKDEFMIDSKPVFGMDCFQIDNVYNILEWSGMKVFNVILYDSVRSKERKTTTNIMDFIDSKKVMDWKFTRISRMVQYNKYFMKANYTNFKGTEKKSRPVYYIPMEIYEELEQINQIIEGGSIRNAEGIILNYEEALSKRCPLCDSLLINRDGAHGQFFGCKNFPICRFTKKYI